MSGASERASGRSLTCFMMFMIVLSLCAASLTKKPSPSVRGMTVEHNANFTTPNCHHLIPILCHTVGGHALSRWLLIIRFAFVSLSSYINRMKTHPRHQCFFQLGEIQPWATTTATTTTTTTTEAKSNERCDEEGEEEREEDGEATRESARLLVNSETTKVIPSLERGRYGAVTS